MSLQGLSPLVFLVGLVALAALLGVLHLLRVRLRRVTVDSLLFFELLGTVERPRVLPGRPARWWAYLLALTLLAGLWATFAGLSQDGIGPSRVVLIDTSGSGHAPLADGSVLLDHRVRQAAALADDVGLGPDGAVFGFGSEVRTLLRAGEPAQLLASRAGALSAAGSGTALWWALRAARARLRGIDGDEIAVIGGPSSLPSSMDGVEVRRIADPVTGVVLGVVAAELRDFPERVLNLEITGNGPCTAELSWDGEVRAQQSVDAKTGESTRVQLSGLPNGATDLELRLRAGDADYRQQLALPPQRELRVHGSDDLAEHLRLALGADPMLAVVQSESAEVVVTTDIAKLPSRPAFVVSSGTGSAAREPRCTDECPLPLGLRDRRRTAAAALVPMPNETVWVEDALSGLPLVAAHRDGAAGEGPWRVRAVAWLLEPPSHRDVPTLLLGSLHALAGPPTTLVGAGNPLPVPAMGKDLLQATDTATGVDFRIAARAGTFQPITDSLELFAPGTARRGELRAVPTVAPPAPANPVSIAMDERSAAGPIPLLLLLLCFALLVADAFLYHRGRIP